MHVRRIYMIYFCRKYFDYLRYEKAIELESDHIFEINYAITLYNKGDIDRAKLHFAEFERLFGTLDDESKNSDADVVERRQQLLSAFSSL